MPELSFDVNLLSSRARRALEIDASTAYGSVVPKQAGSIEARDLLETLKPTDVLAKPPADANAAACVLSGLWLWHDYLDLSHTISQAIETPTGSFWHAIMHRREGDFSNAKYWYRRCTNHPAFEPLAARVRALIHEMPSDNSVFRTAAAGWNGPAYVDLVEAVHYRPDDPRHAAAVAIGRLEWQTLFETSVRDAG